MLTFKQIIDATSKLVQGYQPDSMAEAINDSMNLFASEFNLPFLIRPYYVIMNATTGLGPYDVYEDSAGTIPANWIEPTSHPTKSHISGLVDSDNKRIKFHLEGSKIYLDDSSYSIGIYYFWCLKRPIQFIKESITVNYLTTESDFPEYCKQALSNYIAHFLCLWKRDFERSKYFEDQYRIKYAPLVKQKATGDWGTINSGESAKADTGADLEWA